MMREVVIIAALAILLAAAGAQAQASDEDDAAFGVCVDAARSAIEESGGRFIRELDVRFLVESESHPTLFSLPEDGCFGILGLGHRRVEDLDVLLHTRNGDALAQDVATDRPPYVRICGQRGLELVVTALLFKGQGEYRLLMFDNAPEAAPDLSAATEGCFAAPAGPRRPSAEVGPEPRSEDGSPSTRHVAAELATLGYKPEGPEERGRLAPRSTVQRTVMLDGQQCYAIAAVGGTSVIDLDLVVHGVDGRMAGRDVARDRDALVKLCTESAGAYMLDIRMHEGEGDWALMRFVLEEPPPNQRPAAISGRARIAYAEMRGRMQSRGMEPRPLAWGMLWPGATLSMPVRLDARRCYGFGAVPSDELAAGDLDLILIDDTGALVAWETGHSASPLLYHCTTRAAMYRVLGRVYGAEGRYLAVIGEGRELP